MKVLVTAFNGKNNSSKILLDNMTKEYDKLYLKNSFTTSEKQLLQQIESDKYDLIISFGEAPLNMDEIKIETQAIKNKDIINTNYDYKKIHNNMKENYKVIISINAGNWYCNNIYYYGLKTILLTKNEVFSTGIINSYFPISNEYFLGAKNKDEEDDIKLYQNHSCNPNCGLHGEITFIAMRDINKDEELTTDYAFIDNENYKFHCTCGAENCRGTITGFDWKIKELQDKYYDYFAQYLKDKIDEERTNKNI